MEIKQGEQRFYVVDGQEELGEITFVPQGSDTIAIDHTYVNPSLRGQGIANQLLDKVVAYAREQDLKIVPLCSYARIVMERDTSMHDVLKK